MININVQYRFIIYIRGKYYWLNYNYDKFKYRNVIVKLYKVKVYKVSIFQTNQISDIKQNPKI